MQAYKRLEAVYFPTQKRFKAKGIRINDSNGAQVIHTQPDDVQAAVANYWGDVYYLKEGDYDAMSKLLTYYIRQPGHSFNFDELALPDVVDFQLVIGKAKHSATGPDGLPYAAYKALPEVLAVVLHRASWDLSSELPKSDLAELNAQLVWFALEGAVESTDFVH